MDDQTIRLNRIEEKLDKVSEAIVSLARMEERMITLFKRMDTYDERQTILENRMNKVEVAHATSMVHFIPKAGDLFFTNAWLPHSFSRHGSDEPLRFVHINISVKNAEQQACEMPTVI